jgi:hypothetical protein
MRGSLALKRLEEVFVVTPTLTAFGFAPEASS